MRDLSIVVGTGIQKKLTLKILPVLLEQMAPEKVSIISLERLYQLETENFDFPSVFHINDLKILPAWYDRSRQLKFASLIPYLLQIFALGLKSKNYLFFVDTGMLERSAIFALNLLNRRTIVLQDAMKRKPKSGKKGILNWFGNGKADTYLLMGPRYLDMVLNRTACVVGSPIFKNEIYFPISRGDKILFINQCFSRYHEMSEKLEVGFVKEIIAATAPYGHLEIRLHPHNNYDAYKRLSSNFVEISQNKPLAKSLEEAGIVLAVNSTAILEALTYGLPVLILDWHPSKFELPIQHCVIHCDTIEKMKEWLSKWKTMEKDFYTASKDSLQKELKSHIAFSGQEAVDRVVSELIGIIRGKSR